jgi:hypothetical protein
MQSKPVIISHVTIRYDLCNEAVRSQVYHGIITE